MIPKPKYIIKRDVTKDGRIEYNAYEAQYLHMSKQNKADIVWEGNNITEAVLTARKMNGIFYNEITQRMEHLP